MNTSKIHISSPDFDTKTFEMCHTCNGHGFDEHGSSCKTCNTHHYIHPDVTDLTREQYEEFRSRVRREADKSYAKEDMLREQIKTLQERLDQQHKITSALWDADGTHHNYQHNPVNGDDCPGHWERVADDPKWQNIIDALPADHPYSRSTPAIRSERFELERINGYLNQR